MARLPVITTQGQLVMELFRRKYLQMVDPSEIEVPSGELIKPPHVQAWLCNEVFGIQPQGLLPTARYTFRILKSLIHTLEEAMVNPEEDEISDELMNRFDEVLGKSSQDEISAAQEKCAVTYVAPALEIYCPSVTIMEAPYLLSCGGDSGNRTWAAALFLGTYLFGPGRHWVQSKSVLELGAGLGFLSILCGKHLGAQHVLMTDGSSAVMESARENIELNGVEHVVETSVLKWGTDYINHLLRDGLGLKSYDLVLGADILYDPRDFGALMLTLQQLFSRYPKLKVLISSAIRTESTLEKFLYHCGRTYDHIKKADFIQLVSEEQYEDLVHRRGLAWLNRLWPNRAGPAVSFEQKKEMYWAMIKDGSTPEMIDRRGGNGLWRIPYIPKPGPWGENLTEAIALEMFELEGRWKCVAVGRGANAGDVFVQGPLTREECAHPSREHFPQSLRMYGKPGPRLYEWPVQDHPVGHGSGAASRAPMAPAARQAIPGPNDGHANDTISLTTLLPLALHLIRRRNPPGSGTSGQRRHVDRRLDYATDSSYSTSSSDTESSKS
ncbi:MAG: hypothetical protein Q9219_002274 [cf. Caloplaca sp. 3 TL-2023]